MTVLPDEDVRELLLVALVLHLDGRRLTGFDRRRPWEVAIPYTDDRLSALCGLSEQRAGDLIDGLRSYGVVVLEHGARGSTARFREDVFDTHPMGSWRWEGVLRRLGNEGRLLLCFWAVARLLPPPYTKRVPIGVDRLRDESGYSDRAVRGALKDLVARNVLVREQPDGKRSRFALPGWVVGAAKEPPLAPPTSQHAGEAVAPNDPPPADATPVGDPGAAADLTLRLSGLSIEITGAVPIRVERLEDGTELWHIGKGTIGPL